MNVDPGEPDGEGQDWYHAAPGGGAHRGQHLCDWIHSGVSGWKSFSVLDFTCLVLQQRRPVEVCVLEETAARPPGGHQEGRSRQVEGGMSHPLQYGMVHREFSTLRS